MTNTVEATPVSSAEEGNPTETQYDFVVLGTGEGAKYIAWTLVKQGHLVASIERKYIGGSCPNIACLPSKNVITAPRLLLTSKEVRCPEFPRRTSGLGFAYSNAFGNPRIYEGVDRPGSERISRS